MSVNIIIIIAVVAFLYYMINSQMKILLRIEEKLYFMAKDIEKLKEKNKDTVRKTESETKNETGITEEVTHQEAPEPEPVTFEAGAEIVEEGTPIDGGVCNPVTVTAIDEPQELENTKPSAAGNIVVPPPVPQCCDMTVEANAVSYEEPVNNGYKEPQVKKNSFERMVGENLLSKVGILTLVLGIAYFIKYAIDNDWINEVGRVATGFVIGAVIIGVAHKIRNSLRTFSSILVGGGIASMFITVMFGYWDYGLFSQNTAFVMFLSITALSVFFSLWYDRKELAVVSLLGGFASPFLTSTGEGSYIVLFVYLLILNTGMLVIAYKRDWKIVSRIAYLLTVFTYGVWLIVSFSNEITGALLFGFLIFSQFYILAFMMYRKNGYKLLPYEIMVVLTNNIWFMGAALFVFGKNGYDADGCVSLAMAALNTIPLVWLLRDKNADKVLKYIFIGIVTAFVSLAVPLQLDGSTIILIWSVEAVLLLWLANKSGFSVLRNSFMIVQMLALASLVMYWDKGLSSGPHRWFLNETFITSVAVGIGLAVVIRIITSGCYDILYLKDYVVKRIMKLMLLLVMFVAPVVEICSQLTGWGSDNLMVLLGTYAYVFVAAIVIEEWKRASLLAWKVYLTLAAIAVYPFFLFVVSQICYAGNPQSEFLLWLHLLTMPAVMVCMVYALSRIKEVCDSPEVIYWLTAIVAIGSMSMLTNDIAYMLTGSTDIKMLSSTVYPIVWGVSAFMLLMYGLKRNIIVANRIAFFVFVLIVGKLYLYDVWNMKAPGRIISFVILGILMLTASFSYQKIKLLLNKKNG